MVRNLHRPTGQNKPQKIRCWPKKSRILISNDLCTVLSSSLIPPPPLHLLILSERRLRKVSVLICQCQGSSGSQLTGVRDILEKSVSNDVFLTFLFFFFTVLISSTKQTLSAVDTFISFLHLLIKGPLTHMSLVASRGSSSPPLRAQREG